MKVWSFLSPWNKNYEYASRSSITDQHHSSRQNVTGLAMPPKPWERPLRVDDDASPDVSSTPKPWASSRVAQGSQPIEVVPETSTSTAGPPSSRPWELASYATSQTPGYGAVRYGGSAYGGGYGGSAHGGGYGGSAYGAGNFGGAYGGYNSYGQPSMMMDPSWPAAGGIFGTFASLMALVGRITYVVDSNAAALHYFIGALLQLLERFGSMYSEVARFVLGIVFRRGGKGGEDALEEGWTR